MMLVINSLVPVFALIALGAALRKGGFLTVEVTAGMNKLAYWVLLPVLLFYKLAQAPISAGSASQFFQALLAAAVAGSVGAWIVAKIIRAPMKSTGVMIQAALRGNLAFVGLPIVLFTIATLPEAQQTSIESAMVVAMTLMIIIYSLSCVGVLVYFDREDGARIQPRVFWTNIVKNPLAISCIGGVIFNQLGWSLPLPLSRTCAALAPAAFPVALLGIGSQLAATRVRSHVSWAVAASLVKIIIGPLAGYVVGQQVGLSGIELKVAVLMCGMPTAVSSYILADQMHADADLAAAAVVLCTVFSFFSLSAILILPL